MSSFEIGETASSRATVRARGAGEPQLNAGRNNPTLPTNREGWDTQRYRGFKFQI